MRKLIIALALFLITNLAVGQDFSLDNKRFHTVSWNEFFKRLEKNPKLIYFDIRTEGERCDTSRFASYNQGKIKGAIETDFSDFDKSYPSYRKYQNDTIYLYCSHSRRSRLLAKRLADSSFTKVISINCGLSYLTTYGVKKFPLKDKYYTTKLKYELVTPFDFAKSLKDKKVQVIDIRHDSIYKGTTKSGWEKSFGTIKNALHISNEKITEYLDLIDPSKKIILFDNDGESAPKAANFLIEKKYKVGVLSFGLYNLQSIIPSYERSYLISNYRTIIPSEALELTRNKNTIIIDIRTALEFNSKDSVEWKNVGHLKNAINIPLSKINTTSFDTFKNKNILLYDLGMDDELFEYADQLKEFGFKNIFLLIGGILQVRWEIANENKKELLQLINSNF